MYLAFFYKLKKALSLLALSNQPRMAEGINVSLTLGAFIAGCMVSIGLSAIVGIQTFLYFRLFPMDTLPFKLLVAWVWITDAGHTIAVCTVIWQYGVSNFNNPAKLLEIAPAYPANVILTIIATLNANLFYAWRIHKMSKFNWWFTGPICALCLARTGLGLVNATELYISKTWAIFASQFRAHMISVWAVSAATDIVISAARYYYLRDLKQGYMAKQEMVDAVVVFTINDGLLTCATVITCIACFLAMPTNFVWLSIFFILSKLFANSVLATLNLRNWYRHRHRPMGIPLTRHQAARNTIQMGGAGGKGLQSSDTNDMAATMEVFVDQQVEYNVPVGKYKEDSRDAHFRSGSES
ncbi:hypothetical protein B0H19DRAFT_1238563 [Mycena capillaripes]|nr:hypothetical protein B0H19DRAFT_1238563 [Mycena capillaripes]